MKKEEKFCAQDTKPFSVANRNPHAYSVHWIERENIALVILFVRRNASTVNIFVPTELILEDAKRQIFVFQEDTIETATYALPNALSNVQMEHSFAEVHCRATVVDKMIFVSKRN